MRVMLSRLLGAEIMGIAELAQGVHMLAITPLTSGIPMAISRMTARAPKDEKQKPLLAGIFLVRVASAALIPALLLFSPLLARWMGDVRVLPSLWFSAPCILILGYSAAFNGYCYGMEHSLEPAMSELIEQAARLILSFFLLTWLSRLTAAWLAAVPVVATMLAEIIGLIFVIWRLRIPLHGAAQAAAWREPVLRLAAPANPFPPGADAASVADRHSDSHPASGERIARGGSHFTPGHAQRHGNAPSHAALRLYQRTFHGGASPHRQGGGRSP